MDGRIKARGRLFCEVISSPLVVAADRLSSQRLPSATASSFIRLRTAPILFAPPKISRFSASSVGSMPLAAISIMAS